MFSALVDVVLMRKQLNFYFSLSALLFISNKYNDATSYCFSFINLPGNKANRQCWLVEVNSII